MERLENTIMKTAKWGKFKADLSRLNRSEKFKAVQLLISELAKDDFAMFPPNTEWAVWTPIESFGAVKQLEQLLEKNDKNGHR